MTTVSIRAPFNSNEFKVVGKRAKDFRGAAPMPISSRLTLDHRRKFTVDYYARQNTSSGKLHLGTELRQILHKERFTISSNEHGWLCIAGYDKNTGFTFAPNRYGQFNVPPAVVSDIQKHALINGNDDVKFRAYIASTSKGACVLVDITTPLDMLGAVKERSGGELEMGNDTITAFSLSGFEDFETNSRTPGRTALGDKEISITSSGLSLGRTIADSISDGKLRAQLNLTTSQLLLFSASSMDAHVYQTVKYRSGVAKVKDSMRLSKRLAKIAGVDLSKNNLRFDAEGVVEEDSTIYFIFRISKPTQVSVRFARGGVK